ncbi:MAG: site-specific integrase [Dysgonamonadaceae bacterium]|jgi:integrase|nr:site-specific integrase [Dysgonamonadaceae bacterium]
MNENLKVSFYLKRERKRTKSSAGEKTVYPIVGKIIIGKTVAQFGSKLKVEERLWNVKSGRAIGKSHAATELNREINKVNLLIHSHYSEILKRTGKVTAPEVKNAFQGIASVQKTLLVLFEEIMQEFHSRVGIDRAKSSYRKYVSTYRHLQRFLKAKYSLRDIPLSQLDLPFIESFDFYLRIEQKMKPASVNGVIIQLLSAARVALHRNYISRPPFFGYRLERPDFQIRSLAAGELDNLISTKMESPDLCYVRDMFVFSCFTGISYIDLKNLTWKELITEEDGSWWITKSRQKTGIPFNVKLLDIPVQIIEKYRNFSFGEPVFNMFCQVKTNKLLKEIAILCGINKTLTFHMSRHTFATQICLSQGVPIESVSRMLGHTDIATTQRYAHVNRDKIGNDMKLLSARIADKYAFVI